MAAEDEASRMADETIQMLINEGALELAADGNGNFHLKKSANYETIMARLMKEAGEQDAIDGGIEIDI